jgi:hypothetical protein
MFEHSIDALLTEAERKRMEIPNIGYYRREFTSNIGVERCTQNRSRGSIHQINGMGMPAAESATARSLVMIVGTASR